MPIPGISQPEELTIDAELSLCRFAGQYDQALSWYRDEDTVYMVDGKRELYTPERIRAMYDYQQERGELYLIRYLDRFIGDVCLSADDLPMVIGEKSLRGQGIGKRVLRGLIERGKQLKFTTLYVDEIYRWNQVSQRCYGAVGFLPVAKTENGYRYRLTI